MKLFQLIIGTLVLTSIVKGDALLFDFGPKNSPLREGATLVAESGGERAVWDKTNGLKSYLNEIDNEWKTNKSRGKTLPPPVFQNDLTCDYIASTQPRSLKLNVPPGPCEVILLCGRSGKKPAQIWDIHVTDGTTAVSATFAGIHELRRLQLNPTATDKGIELQFTTRSRWLINAIIVIPESDREAAQTKLIDPLMKECFMLPPAEMAKWKETPHSDPTPEPLWTEQQKRDGLALFSRPWVEPVWPNQFPLQHELDAPVRAFAAQGEYEPLTFTLHPLQDFSNASISDIRLINTAGDEQHSISDDQIELRFVRYLYVRPNYSTFNSYYRAPDVLMPWQPQPLTKGENLRIWITVKTGTAQPQGIYSGQITITADKISLSLPLSLRVLPITLQKNQSLVYGQYYYHPLDNLNSTPDDFSRSWWQHKAETEHTDMREHGMNTVVLGLSGHWKNERWHYYYDLLQRKIDLYRSVGFDKPIICHIPYSALYRKYMNDDMGSHLSLIKMPPDEFFTELTMMVQSIENEARRRQWPELLYYPVDEPSTSPVAVEFMTRTMASIKKVPGVRTYVTADPEHEQFAPMRPYVDIWCCQPFALGRTAVLADMKERGVEYWCYPNHISGENDHTPTIGARMTYGFGFWEAGYRALVPWIYQYSSGDPWNNLDSATQEFFNRTADDGSPIPVTLWEADREGIDDHRYIFTLQNAITRARETGHREAADKAQATLDKIFNTIEVQPKYKNDGLWEAGTFNTWRWAIAEQILALQELD